MSTEGFFYQKINLLNSTGEQTADYDVYPHIHVQWIVANQGPPYFINICIQLVLRGFEEPGKRLIKKKTLYEPRPNNT